MSNQIKMNELRNRRAEAKENSKYPDSPLRQPLRTAYGTPLLAPNTLIKLIVAMIFLAAILIYNTEDRPRKTWSQMTMEERRKAGVSRILWEIQNTPSQDYSDSIRGKLDRVLAAQKDSLEGRMDWLGMAVASRDFCKDVWPSLASRYSGSLVLESTHSESLVDWQDVKDVVVDFGSPSGNVGQQAAKLGLHTISIHPQPSIALRGSTCSLNITLLQGGFSAKNQRCNLFKSPNNSIVSDCDDKVEGEYLMDYPNVPLDSLVPTEKVGLLYLNLAGSPLSALKGAKQVLLRSKDIQIFIPIQHVSKKALHRLVGWAWSVDLTPRASPKGAPLQSVENLEQLLYISH
jgi:hypothetical protein